MSITEDIAAQQLRVSELLAALDRVQLIKSDVDFVPILASGSPEERQRGPGPSHILHSLQDNSGAASSMLSSTSVIHKSTTTTRKSASSTVPGFQAAAKEQKRRQHAVPSGVRGLGATFSSGDSLPKSVASAPPYRPSFYTTNFRDSTRQMYEAPQLSFDSGLASSPSPHMDVSSIKQSPSSPRTTDNNRSNITKEEVTQHRHDILTLEALRDQLREESHRLIELAQRVRHEHAQVQRRAEALTIRERTIAHREKELAMHAQRWRDETLRIKHHHASELRLANNVAHQLHEELIRCGGATKSDRHGDHEDVEEAEEATTTSTATPSLEGHRRRMSPADASW